MTVRAGSEGQASPGFESLLGIEPGADLVVVRDGSRHVLASRPSEVVRASGDEALRFLDQLTSGWWAGWVSYELGDAVEPSPERQHIGPSPGAGDPEVPDLCLARFERCHALSTAELARIARPAGHASRGSLAWRSSLDPATWDRSVRSILGHLTAGDCYQVNLTRRLDAEAQVDPLRLYRALLATHPSPHGALVRIGPLAAVSASPELFLRRSGDLVESRPIKGTSSDPQWLQGSRKDRAENVMIVDLVRNDLGRVCEYGTIEVPALCALEEHPGLFHLVSTVRGRLRTGVTPGALIRATFPPASVTGCPKPRVLDMIRSLEPVPRGIYCGAIGFIDAGQDRMELNVAIRTFTMARGRIQLGVGGGIVADSDAGAEWEETELKASRLLAVAADCAV